MLSCISSSLNIITLFNCSTAPCLGSSVCADIHWFGRSVGLLWDICLSQSSVFLSFFPHSLFTACFSLLARPICKHVSPPPSGHRPSSSSSYILILLLLQLIRLHFGLCRACFSLSLSSFLRRLLIDTHSLTFSAFVPDVLSVDGHPLLGNRIECMVLAISIWT